MARLLQSAHPDSLAFERGIAIVRHLAQGKIAKEVQRGLGLSAGEYWHAIAVMKCHYGATTMKEMMYRAGVSAALEEVERV